MSCRSLGLGGSAVIASAHGRVLIFLDRGTGTDRFEPYLSEAKEIHNKPTLITVLSTKVRTAHWEWFGLKFAHLYLARAVPLDRVLSKAHQQTCSLTEYYSLH